MATTEGPVLVLAGAGSGKTRVLTNRIAYLIAERHISPWEILAMTFTNKAAGEMKERLEGFGLVDHGLWIGTFHSIFARILRWEAEWIGYTSDYVIYDTDDQERLVKSVMEELNISPKHFSPRSILSQISKAKNSLISHEEYTRTAQTLFEESVSMIYPEYDNRLRNHQAFDFDDLITVPIQMFDNRPDILNKYQTRFKYILVDEYQDTNRAQYKLLHQLAGMHRNLCVVGDDDQSIYRWRGADVRNILEFEKDFPDTKVYRLEQNYRSTRNILAAASSVVQKNVNRKPKTLWTDNTDGEKLQLLEVSDEREEARRIVEKIQEEVYKRKRSFQDFAILYRTNAQSRALEDGLRQNGISYVIVGGVRFYERKEVKDVLAYMRLITNPRDAISLIRIINFPARGIGEKTLNRVRRWAQGNRVDLFEALGHVDEMSDLTNRARENIRHFFALIQKYIALKGDISPNELVHALVDETGLLAAYKEDTSPEGLNRLDNIRELLSAFGEYVVSTENPTLSEFLDQVSLITDVDAWDDRNNAVTLMTLHCAKGLEFPVVFISGLEEGLFPLYRNTETEEELEEERRLFYVGLTRAMEQVYLIWAARRSRFYEPQTRLPSRFLDEMDRSYVEVHSYIKSRVSAESFRRRYETLDFDFDAHPDYESFSQEEPGLRIGMWVMHEVFGKGQILHVEGGGEHTKVVVRFEGGMKKKFLVRYAKFSIV